MGTLGRGGTPCNGLGLFDHRDKNGQACMCVRGGLWIIKTSAKQTITTVSLTYLSY